MKKQPLSRPDLYIVCRILERLWDNDGPMVKTRLQVATNINYDSFIRYLDWMLDHGLVSITQEDGHDKVVLTAKGSEAYRTVVMWVRERLEDGSQRVRPPK